MHPIKRAFLVFVLGVGTVAGFAHGFHSLGRCASSHRERHRMAFEEHVADVCLRAADRRAESPAAPSGNLLPTGNYGWAPGPAYAPVRPTPTAAPVAHNGCGSAAAVIEAAPPDLSAPAPTEVLVAPPPTE